MKFSPLLIVATATYLASASPLLHARFDLTQRADGTVDPHDPPEVPANHTFPAATGGAGWKDAFEKAKSIVDQMTIQEKVNVTSGIVGPCVGNTAPVPRFGIPSMCLEDGPLGVRPVDFVSQFPAGVTVAATWDHDLFWKRANSIGEEFKGKGVHVALGPVTGGPLGRSPLAGRNWEGFSPDNYLNGIGSKLSVDGMQAAGVVACSKHFIGYEQETYRDLNIVTETNLTKRYQQIDSIIDDKTMHELYLTSFAEAVRAGTGSIMCSYNSVDGQHACGNDNLLNGILKSELGFQGHVVSDWGGTWDTVKDASYGLDVSMPGLGFGGVLGTYFNDELVEAIGSGAGQVSEARLNDMAIRTLTPFFWLNQNDSSYPAVSFVSDNLSPLNQDVNVQADHWKVIRKIGEESATLLKNNRNGTYGLPIDSSIRKIGVFGQDAGPPTAGLTGCGTAGDCVYDVNANALAFTEYPHHNGTQSSGGGSGTALPPYVINPLEAIAARGRRLGLKVDYALGDNPYNPTQEITFVAEGSEKCIVFVSAFQSESYDRISLLLDNEGDSLINLVAASCADVNVVIHSGQQVDMEAWIDNENVTSVVFAYYPGQESGEAIASVLFGDLSPSGKLPFTIAKDVNDYPGGTGSIVTANVAAPVSNFTEGLFVDYKWFDAQGIEPRFPFGFGMSYSSFAYSDVSVAETYAADSGYVQKTNEAFDGEGDLYDVRYTVSVKVKNTGNWTAAEVAQMYLTFPESESDQPVRLLRGFCKETYTAGQEQTITFPVRAKDMAVWSSANQTWLVPTGEYTFSVGPSSRDLPLTTTVTI
ncbi:Glycoside hydrolase, superfamily [Phaffia rhodozyma]|uniref:Probable beta-glucosidase G n=1 Tax=Phaffia rhodozyma TaxID=264483 RepID=A0A0F7SLV1_PHARH|nr:Glycoside hydrolase, superfamily [Phaffia rhodozyma]